MLHTLPAWIDLTPASRIADGLLMTEFEKGDWKKETRYRIPPARSDVVQDATKLDFAEVETVPDMVAVRAQAE